VSKGVGEDFARMVSVKGGGRSKTGGPRAHAITLQDMAHSNACHHTQDMARSNPPVWSRVGEPGVRE